MIKPPSNKKVESATSTAAYLYLLFPRRVSIDEQNVNEVKEKTKNSQLKELNLVIQSSGGDPYSAVKIIRVLRRKFSKIVGFVPSYAMSAATLMLLGTDQICMGEDSQLGPLDLPIEHPSDGSIISALDMVNALPQLGLAASSLAIDIYEQLRNLSSSDRLGKTAAGKLAFGMATEIIKPVVGKIDPFQRQKGFRSLKIAQWYAYDLLRTGMMKGKSAIAWRTATKFVHQFPDHSYAIFRDEARESLSLDIEDGEKHSEWEKICSQAEDKSSGLTNVLINYSEQ